MDDELGAAAFVEETFHDQPLLRRQNPKRRFGTPQVIDHLRGGISGYADFFDQIVPRSLCIRQPCIDVGA